MRQGGTHVQGLINVLVPSALLARHVQRNLTLTERFMRSWFTKLKRICEICTRINRNTRVRRRDENMSKITCMSKITDRKKTQKR